MTPSRLYRALIYGKLALGLDRKKPRLVSLEWWVVKGGLLSVRTTPRFPSIVGPL